MIEVREVQRGDGDAIFEMIRDMRMNFLKKTFMPSMGSGANLERLLFDDEYSNTLGGCIALVDGKPAGMALWVVGVSTCHCLRDWEVKNFYVLGEYRRQGVGSAMIEWMKSKAAEDGMFALEVFNMGIGADSLSFWMKHGSKPNEVRLRFNVSCIDVDADQRK